MAWMVDAIQGAALASIVHMLHDAPGDSTTTQRWLLRPRVAGWGLGGEPVALHAWLLQSGSLLSTQRGARHCLWHRQPCQGLNHEVQAFCCIRHAQPELAAAARRPAMPASNPGPPSLPKLRPSTRLNGRPESRTRFRNRWRRFSWQYLLIQGERQPGSGAAELALHPDAATATTRPCPAQRELAGQARLQPTAGARAWVIWTRMLASKSRASSMRKDLSPDRNVKAAPRPRHGCHQFPSGRRGGQLFSQQRRSCPCRQAFAGPASAGGCSSPPWSRPQPQRYQAGQRSCLPARGQRCAARLQRVAIRRCWVSEGLELPAGRLECPRRAAACASRARCPGIQRRHRALAGPGARPYHLFG